MEELCLKLDTADEGEKLPVAPQGYCRVAFTAVCCVSIYFISECHNYSFFSKTEFTSLVKATVNV